jgi:hypothetical protein
MPDFKQLWVGFCSVEVDPSPNVQIQLVGKLIDLSVNWTVNGRVPDVTEAEKSVFWGFFGIPVVGTVEGWVVGVTVGVGPELATTM